MNEDHENKKEDGSLDNYEKEGHDDVLFDEDVDQEGEELSPRDAIKKLREKLKKCGEEKQEYLVGWQRAKADFVNARKADEESRKDFITYANQGLIEELLPVIESFQMAFSNKETWEKVDANWRTGIEYIYGKLMSTLKQHGLKELDPAGETFDPAQHASFENVPTDDPKEDHVIVAVIQKGYSLNGKVIKPPNVRVAVFEGKPTTDNSPR